MTAAPTAFPRLLALSDSALTVVFGESLAQEVHGQVIGLARALEARRGMPSLRGVSEWISAFGALTVYFDADKTDVPALEAELLALARVGSAAQISGRQWELPACFDAEFAPDLQSLAGLSGLSVARVLDLFTQACYRVYTIGFLPGFPYMGRLPAALEAPRLETPRIRVPARSIAVAGTLCAAYPFESPGGWRLLGRTPLRLFDPAREQAPALLAPGDQVRWISIERKTFERLEREAAAGGLDPASFMTAPGT